MKPAIVSMRTVAINAIASVAKQKEPMIEASHELFVAAIEIEHPKPEAALAAAVSAARGGDNRPGFELVEVVRRRVAELIRTRGRA